MFAHVVLIDKRGEIARETHLREEIDHGVVGMVLTRDIVFCVREAMRCETRAFVSMTFLFWKKDLVLETMLEAMRSGLSRVPICTSATTIGMFAFF